MMRTSDSGQYQVLARKWRPQQFDEVVGQDAVVRTLSNALRQSRIAHAYCFSGIRGVGKTTAARLLAKGLNCQASDGPTAEPCGRCESCREIEESRSMDVVELDAASQTGVDNIRELTEVTRYAPSRDRHRIFIIDEAHMLSTSAFNALLKTLEEPPPHVVFVLATTEPNKILPTVLSRCQHYQFGRISQRRIVDHLRRIADAEGIAVTDDSLALIATAADGSLRDAQSLLDKLIAFAGDEVDEQTVVDLLGLVERVLLFRAADLIADGDLAGVLRFVNDMVERGVDLHQFTVDLLGHLRDLLVARSMPDPGDILHLPDADMERLREQAAGFQVEDLDRAFSLLSAAEYRIKMAEQPRYHLEVALGRLARLPHLEPIESLIAELRGDGTAAATEDDGGGSGGGASGTAGAASGGSPRGRTGERDRGPTAAEQDGPPTGTASTQPAKSPAPREGKPETVRTDPATPTAAVDGDGEPSTAAGDDEQAGGRPPRALLARIQEEVGSTHPLVAGVLDRTCGIELAGETIVFNFPPEASVLSRRVESPDVLDLLSEVSQRILGRRVVARVGVAAAPSPDTEAKGAGGSRPVAPVGDASSAPRGPASGRDPAVATRNGDGDDDGDRAATTAPPASDRRHAAPPEPPPVDRPPAGTEGTPGGSTDRQTLMQRVESEPLVQEFVRALRGQITSVEELRGEP